jgi:hypothetical protein
MKKNVRILLLEDDLHFNNLLLGELKKCVKADRFTKNFSFMFHSYANAGELIHRLKCSDLRDDYSVAFIDYYLGSGINGSHIIGMLKEQYAETAIVLISQSKNVKEKISPSRYDYFVTRDSSAAALCRLCLEQYLENKLFIPLL